MKKVFLFFLAAVIFTDSIFARGGGYFDENFSGFYTRCIGLNKILRKRFF